MSDGGIRLELSRMPSPTLGLARAALARRRGLPAGGTIPRIEAVLPQVGIDRGHAGRYAELCGFTRSSGLPLTYPHVLAAPLHLKVLTHRAFPLRLLGAVHVRNEIRRYRVLEPGERFTLRVHVEGHRDVDKGLEFDLCTDIDDATGVRVWEEISTNLIRRPDDGSSGAGRRGPPDIDGLDPLATWRVPADIGRRYGRVAGDLNPIHLNALVARLFGFPRAIAHGMWSHARAIAALTEAAEPAALRAAVTFRRPILLPSTVVLRAVRNGAETRHAVTDEHAETVHLTGELATIPAG